MKPELKELRVPFGLDQAGAEVRPESADRMNVYVCPSCKALLILRVGSRNRPHFAHKVDPNYCDFLNETEEHFRAKTRVVDLVKSKTPFLFIRHCNDCGRFGDQELPSKVVDAVTEYLLPSGHRADVGLLDDCGKLLAVIEVVVSHAVEPEKKEYFDNNRIYWAEFDAMTILGSDRWHPKIDGFKKYVCARCHMIDKNRRTLPWVNRGACLVACPRRNDQCIVCVDVCSFCDGFYSIDEEGVICLGKERIEIEAH